MSNTRDRSGWTGDYRGQVDGPATSERVVLRPIEESDLPMLQAMTGTRKNVEPFMYYGLENPDRWARDWAAGSLRVRSTGGSVTVLLDEEVAGTAGWNEHGWFGRPCWTLGITLMPAARGQGCGTEVQRQLVDYLFDTTVFNRVEVDNVAEQRALENAGFTREGVLRGSCWRLGSWRDGVLYSVTRDEHAT